MKISLIITVLNESHTIDRLFKSISNQTRRPDEVVIVDGGSSDDTLKKIKNFITIHKANWRVFSKEGSISVGRNHAIAQAKYSWLAISDAGCVQDKNWLEELEKAVLNSGGKEPDIVAGYYRGLATTPFEEAVVPYVLVMPGKVNPDNFLPATRSMMMKKKVWQELGGFDEDLDFSEDYIFARKFKEHGFKIVFAPKAMISWFPRQNLKQFIKMISKTARNDIKGKVIRPKVMLIFARYILGLILTFWLIWKFSIVLALLGALLGLFIYSVWSIMKNARYVSHGWYWLPVLQISSDLAVIWGSLRGWF